MRVSFYVFKEILVVIVLFLIVSCSVEQKYEEIDEKKITNLNKSKFDSIKNILDTKNKPSQVSSLINKLIKETKSLKNSEDLIKRYRLIVSYYMLIYDYKNSDIYLYKLRSIFKKNGDWNSYVRLSKSIAMSYRTQKRYDEMEKVLQDGIRVAKEKNVKGYDLFPIHEIAVFYSYDMKDYKTAIKYGELFFSKLAVYDSLKIESKFIEKVKLVEPYVMNLILGKAYIETNNLKQAYLNLKIAEKHYSRTNDSEKLERVYSSLIDYHIKNNNLDKVREHKQKYVLFQEQHKDSLIASFKKVTEAKLNLAESEKEVFALKEENKIKRILISGIAILLILIVVFQRYFLRLKYQQKKISLELEKEHEFNKFRASLFINIAHEIRTPISLILGYLELSSQKGVSKDKIQTYFNKIKKNSNKVINDISDIIYLLKENKDSERISLENVIIEPFLKQQFFSFEGIAKIKEIDLSYNSSLPSGFLLYTNTLKLESLINNLVSNAIKFSPKKTEVTFSVLIEDNFLSIIVADQGPGIINENQKNIFNKFYQENKEGKSEGFGIGLAIVKDIVDKLKGKIKLDSSPKKGTSFKVLLPLLNQNKLVSNEVITPNKKIVENEVKSIENTGLKTHNLLVVEDNSRMIDYYKEILSPLYNCNFAFNGKEALEILKNTSFDMIISDIMMPKMDGIEFRKKLKQVPSYDNIPFIMATALGYEEDKIKVFNIGVDDYIVKPFGKNELIARINCLLENKEKREVWKQQVPEKEIETFDQKNIKKMQGIIIRNIEKEDFSVVTLAKEVNFSQRQLERIIKKLTGLTPVKFILEVRLQEAYKKIKNKEEADINNVRYAVGIKSASYFSVKFKQRFGVSPRDLLKENKVSLK
ncbi:hybrid sensor histidine kinase/response regulator transcription factor [Tenacibaculum sp. nBUS_03]|uniref:hybrid sensor histidine kinase/response regulator transcription factor n=1 Tax=Tenacibaculum sp. nBUS_03 TaxID=3395320 RepID=UPI003EBEF0BC